MGYIPSIHTGDIDHKLSIGYAYPIYIYIINLFIFILLILHNKKIIYGWKIRTQKILIKYNAR